MPLLRLAGDQVELQAPAGLSIQVGSPLSTTLSVFADGYVGIGAASPGAKLEVSGELKVGAPGVPGMQLDSSALYFTKTDHSHTGFANFDQHSGAAAIENAANYNALMILGRSTAQGRRVALWDHLDVNGGLAVTGDLDVSGTIRSPRWKLIQVMSDVSGALPTADHKIKTGGGGLLIFASGSGWSRGPGAIGMEIHLDGRSHGRARALANEPNSHKAFVAQALVVTGIAAGDHQLSLVPWNNTITDENDFFTVTILELPCEIVIPSRIKKGWHLGEPIAHQVVHPGSNV